MLFLNLRTPLKKGIRVKEKKRRKGELIIRMGNVMRAGGGSAREQALLGSLGERRTRRRTST